jgi:hypothetical protein
LQTLPRMNPANRFDVELCAFFNGRQKTFLRNTLTYQQALLMVRVQLLRGGAVW